MSPELNKDPDETPQWELAASALLILFLFKPSGLKAGWTSGSRVVTRVYLIFLITC